MQDQKTYGRLQRRLGSEERQTSIQPVEHARTDFGVPEKMHFAIRRDRARLDLANVVQQRRPTNFDPRYGLTNHLLRVFPDVFVAPFAVAEADEGFDFGEHGGESAAIEQ